MRLFRLRWPLLLLLAGALGAVLAALLLQGEWADGPFGGEGERSAAQAAPVGHATADEIADGATGETVGARTARLAGRVAAAPDAVAPRLASDTPGAPASAEARVLRRQPSRVVDAAGHAVGNAQVVLLVAKRDGTVRVNLRTDDEGRVDLVWPEDRVVSLRVDVSGPGREFRVVAREDEGGIDLVGLGEIALDDLVYLPVRTVDPWRAPRPGQRILYRYGEEGEKPESWWGATSDADGRLMLGPFARGASVEVRPGPRGLGTEAIADTEGWQRAVADGQELEVVVPPAPKLRLACPDVAPGVSIPIVVLDLRTGEPTFPPITHAAQDGVWTAPALVEDLDLGVVVGPLADGRFARLAHVSPADEPIDVMLQPGVALAGCVKASDVWAPLTGSVTAYGRGFAVQAALADGGCFAFPGVPDEPLTLVASARIAGGETRAFGGLVRRVDERELEIRVAPLVRVRGTVLEQEGSGERPSRRLAQLRATSDGLPRALQPSVPCGASFVLNLLPRRWRLSVSTRDGQRHAALDLGDLQADLDGVVLRLR